MRKVFTPPKVGGGIARTAVGAALLTFAVFLVLPLTQMISSGLGKKVDLVEANTVAPPPPPPPPPPEQEEEPPPPPPDMPQPDLSTPTPSFDLPSLDLGVGTGVAWNPGDAVANMGDFRMDSAVDLGAVDEKPVPISQVQPQHPPALRRAKVEGSVVLLLIVNEAGVPESIEVESSSRPEFEQPTIEAVRKWRFRPGTRNGEPAASLIRLPFRFSISS